MSCAIKQNINRGAEWHLWDLHVHTPMSLEHNYKCASNEDIWDKYIDELENLPSNIKVLGINDYFFIDGYKEVLKYKEQGRLQNIDLILPVIELRLAKFGGNEKFRRINYHIIFSNELTPDQIEQQFLYALTSYYKLSPDCKHAWNGVITRESLIELGKKVIDSLPDDIRKKHASPIKEGFNNINLEVTKIEAVLKQADCIFNGKYITAIGKTEWDDFKWNDNSIAEKKTIINNADIIFTAAENIESYQKSKDKLKKQGVKDLLLDCSDAHSFASSKNKDRLGNCKTWIKADTTFEGLKQILFEPEERVKIQNNKPDNKNHYQVIDSITLNEDKFWNGTIYLNQNLNTIVGGRSTGKSSLLKAIAAKHDNEHINKEDFIMEHLDGVSIKWKDGNEESSRKIEYFPQSYMHKIASNPDKFNEVVKNIIRSNGKNDFIYRYKNQLADTKKKIIGNVVKIFQIKEEIKELKEELKEKGNKDGILSQLDSLKEDAKKLQEIGNLSQEQQEELKEIEKQIQLKKDVITRADNDLTILNGLPERLLFDSNIIKTTQADKLSFNLNMQNFKSAVNELKEEVNTKWSEIISELIKSTSNDKVSLVKELKELENSSTYVKAKEIFESNDELIEITRKISKETTKLSEIEKKENKLKNICKDYYDCFDMIIENHDSYKGVVENICEELKIKYRDLNIDVQCAFLKDKFQEFLENRLNQQGNARQNYLQSLVDNYGSGKSKINDFLDNLLSDKVVLKNDYKAFDVALNFFPTNWYECDYNLIYQGDNFIQMSEGKQAFVILKLLLEFSENECPILIDQPEDSLDNRAIYNELVKYIKDKKKKRQIILVTHNSNLVVSADAENIIVANQHGIGTSNEGKFKFKYINGALENTKDYVTAKDSEKDTRDILSSRGIREHICDILEGGPDAFKKREQKYGFKL